MKVIVGAVNMKRPIALIDAYSEKMVQETIEGFASNKELHEQLQQIMKEQSINVNTKAWVGTSYMVHCVPTIYNTPI